MSAAHPAGSPAARLTDTISAARTACPGQPARAEQREPRSGALDRPPQRSYLYQHQSTARPARCGLIDRRICGVDSDTPQTPNDFGSLQELARRLMDFGQHYRNIAQPFEWTFTREDLQRVLDKSADHEPQLALAA